MNASVIYEVMKEKKFILQITCFSMMLLALCISVRNTIIYTFVTFD